MTAVNCRMSDELASQIRELKDNHNRNNYALVVKCNLSNATVELEEELENVSSEDIGDEIPDDARFIFYRFQRDDFPSTLSFFWFNPGNLRPDISRTYQNESFKIESTFNLQCVQLSSKIHFKNEWMISKAFGMQGKMTDLPFN